MAAIHLTGKQPQSHGLGLGTRDFQTTRLNYLLQFIERPLQAVFIVRYDDLIIRKHEGFNKIIITEIAAKVQK